MTNPAAPAPREAQTAAMILGSEATDRIVGIGGLSGATAAQLTRLVEQARTVGA